MRTHRVDVCGISQFLLVGFAVAVVVSSVLMSDALGWLAGAAAALALAGWRRWRGTPSGCDLPPG